VTGGQPFAGHSQSVSAQWQRRVSVFNRGFAMQACYWNDDAAEGELVMHVLQPFRDSAATASRPVLWALVAPKIAARAAGLGATPFTNPGAA